MKISFQNIPVELAEAYKRLIARKPTAAGDEFTTRTKPRVKKKAPKKKKSKALRDYEDAVDFLIAYLTKKNGEPPASTFRAAQIAALKAGNFDTAYWVKCTEDSSVTLENAPTSGPFVGVRNYAYPDPYNQPSTPTYGPGITTTGDPAYTGLTTNEIFSDTGLRWIRKVFSLKNKFTKGTTEPLFLKLSGTITATASTRPSRAMISAIIKRWMVAAGSARLTTTEAPVIKPISAFWRYKTPRGEAPYFALTKTLQLMYSMRSADYEEITGDLTKAVVLVAPMPMMGKRFNNNTSITSTIAATVELWQIAKTETVIVGWSHIASGQERAFRWTTAGMVDLGTLGGTQSYAEAVSDDGSIVVGWSYNSAGMVRAFKWTATGMIDLGTLGGLVSRATAISSDGSTIIGWAEDASGNTLPVRWIGGVIYSLGSLGGSYGVASAVSADGSAITGYSYTVDWLAHAFRWTPAGIMDLGLIGGAESIATAISSDGSTITGEADNINGYTHAFRWTVSGIEDLGTLGGNNSAGTALSANGLSIVGWANIPTGRTHAFKWTTGGMIDLGTLGGTYAIASAISEDGTIIIGESTNTAGKRKATRWYENVITDLGTLGGYSSKANAMTADGSKIVGFAENTSFRLHAVLWSEGGITDLGTLGGLDSNAIAISAN